MILHHCSNLKLRSNLLPLLGVDSQWAKSSISSDSRYSASFFPSSYTWLTSKILFQDILNSGVHPSIPLVGFRVQKGQRQDSICSHVRLENTVQLPTISVQKNLEFLKQKNHQWKNRTWTTLSQKYKKTVVSEVLFSLYLHKSSG